MHQFLHTSISAVQFRAPDAHRRPDALLFVDRRFEFGNFDFGAHWLYSLDRRLRTGVRDQDKKFIVPKASNLIVLPE